MFSLFHYLTKNLDLSEGEDAQLHQSPLFDEKYHHDEDLIQDLANLQFDMNGKLNHEDIDEKLYEMEREIIEKREMKLKEEEERKQREKEREVPAKI